MILFTRYYYSISNVTETGFILSVFVLQLNHDRCNFTDQQRLVDVRGRYFIKVVEASGWNCLMLCNNEVLLHQRSL